MNISRANLFLGVLMLGVLVLAVLVGRDMSRPNYEFLPDMKYSPAYSAYSQNPNFLNGRTLQPPVPGTIARGERSLHYAASPADAKRAGRELANPFAGDKKTLHRSTQRGAKVYRVYCTVCHAQSGQADDIQKLPLVQRSILRPKPLATGDSIKMKDGQLFHILTYGQGAMTDFKGQLTRRQRWDAVNYTRDLQRRHTEAEKRKAKSRESKTETAGTGKTAPKPGGKTP